MLPSPKNLIFLISGFATATSLGQFVINEIDADTPGSDTAEFVEIYRPDGTGDSLAGHVLVFFDGSDPSDSVYRTIDLGAFVLDPAGYFVIGGGDFDFFEVDLSFGPGEDFIRNGTNALALYSGTTAMGYLNGNLTTPVDNGDLVDVVIHRVGTSEDATLSAVFGTGDQPDEDENSDSANQSVQRNPDAGSAFRIDVPTTRSTNTPLPRFRVLPSPVQVNEDAGVGASIVTLFREGDVSSGVSVNITVSPFGSLRLLTPMSASFGAGEATTTFAVDTVPNDDVDGDAIFEITVSEVSGGPGSMERYQDGVGDLVLKDEEVSSPTLVINEMLRNAEGGQGAEFLEIYNSSLTVNLSNYELVFYSADPEENFGDELLSITIPSGTISNGGFFTIANSALSTVYGVTPDLLITDLDLPNDDVTVILFNAAGNPEYSALLQDGELDAVPNSGGVPLAADVLVTPDEGDNPAGYFLTSNGGEISQILESVAASAEEGSATPDASNVIPPSLFLTRGQELIEEVDSGGVAFTVTRVPNTSGNLTVTINNFGDDDELLTPLTVTIPDGRTSVRFLGVPVTDGIRDGIQQVNVEVSAPGHDSDTSEVTVLDSDIPDLALCDIAFVASISDGPDQGFAFVTLTEIFSGTRITLTDKGWRAGGGFLDGEEEMKWLAVDDVPAGTVVTFTNNTPDVGTADSGSLNLSDSGDQIFAFQGDSSSPTLIAGIQMNGAWDADATDIHTSALPAALASGGAIAIDPERNNAVYSGSTSDTLENLKLLLFTDSNFTSGNNSGVAGVGMIPSSFSILTSGLYDVTLEGFSVSGGQATLSFTATGLSDIYVSVDLQNWSLASGGADVASGTYVDSSPPAGKAFYLIQEAGSEAP